MVNQVLQQDILKELGIDQLPQERQNEVLSVMTEVILKRLTLRLLSGLADAQRAEFEEIAKSGDTEKITAFFSKNVPNYEKTIQEEIELFRSEMTETVNALLA
jgi:hypothetical protein